MTPKQWPARAVWDQVLADSCIAFLPEADGFEAEFRTRSRFPAARYGRSLAIDVRRRDRRKAADMGALRSPGVDTLSL
jgi:hypothetical protein